MRFYAAVVGRAGGALDARIRRGALGLVRKEQVIGILADLSVGGDAVLLLEALYGGHGEFAEFACRTVVEVSEVAQALLHERDFIAAVVLGYDAVCRHAKGRDAKERSEQDQTKKSFHHDIILPKKIKIANEFPRQALLDIIGL